MRPCKTAFGTISYQELQRRLNEVNIFGLTVDVSSPDVFVYKFVVMFRDNKKRPEELLITVSRISKNVIDIKSNRRTFSSIEDFIDRVIAKKERA